MNKVTYNGYTFSLGQRVAAQVGSKNLWFFGFIEEVQSNKLKIRFDLGHPIYKVKTIEIENVFPVINWKLTTKGVPVDQLNITKQEFHETAKRQLCDVNVHFVKALWDYANEVGFNGKLKPLKLLVKSGEPLGMYSYAGSGSSSMTISSNKNTSANIFFNTVVHEMVHQQNFEIDAKTDKGLLAELGKEPHGSAFLKYAPELKQKLGVVIEELGNVNDVTFNRELLSTEVKKSRVETYFISIHFPVDNDRYPVYAGAYFKNADKANEFYLLAQRPSYRQAIFKNTFNRLTTSIATRSFFEILYDRPYTYDLKMHNTNLRIYKTKMSGVKKIMELAKSIDSANSLYTAISAYSPKNHLLLKPTLVAEFTYNSIKKHWKGE